MTTDEHRTRELPPTGTRDSPASLREIAEEAALLAGAYLQGVFRQGMQIEYKCDRHDLVTVHDRTAEDLIVPFLLEHGPDWRIVGEEGGVREGNSEVTWFIDPIDCTSNFAQGLAFFCVAIGVEIAGELAAGVVYDPIAGNLFSADDAGAYLNGSPLVTPAPQPDGAATLITGYPTANDLQLDGPAAFEDLGELIAAFSSLRRTGSGALTLAHVAAGWTDCAFGGSVNPWDVAGGALIVRRAGGSYRPLWLRGTDGGVGAHHAPAFVAAGPGAAYPALESFVQRISARRA